MNSFCGNRPQIPGGCFVKPFCEYLLVKHVGNFIDMEKKYIKLLEKYDVNQLHHEIMGYPLQYKSFMP